MILNDLVGTVLHGPDRWLKDDRTGLKVVKIRDNLLIYRHGTRKLWVDLEVKLIISWKINTQAEVLAFNALLNLLGIEDFYEFIRSGRTVMLNAGGKWYQSAEYGIKFGHLGRNPSIAGWGD
jgi:hypothetical protein